MYITFFCCLSFFGNLFHCVFLSCHMCIYSEFTLLYTTLLHCLNVREVVAWNIHNIWRLSNCNQTRSHNQAIFGLNGWVFVYELRGYGFKSWCSHLFYHLVNLELLLLSVILCSNFYIFCGSIYLYLVVLWC